MCFLRGIRCGHYITVSTIITVCTTSYLHQLSEPPPPPVRPHSQALVDTDIIKADTDDDAKGLNPETPRSVKGRHQDSGWFLASGWLMALAQVICRLRRSSSAAAVGRWRRLLWARGMGIELC